MTTTTTTRTNRYAGRCAGCGTTVPAEAGTLERTADGWSIRHADGDCPTVAPATATRIAVEDAGVYVLPDGAIALVKCNRDHSRTYAKRWVEITGERLTEADDRVHGDYVYEPGLVARVAADGRKMTYTEAAEFLVRYGRCVRCSRHLKAADSVERGLGPVCVQYFQGA